MQNQKSNNNIKQSDKLLIRAERELYEYLNEFDKLYEISHNSEKLFITLSSVILVASFSFIKLLPQAEFKILLLCGWLSFCLVAVIIIWNQIHYRNALLDRRLYKLLYFFIKSKESVTNKELKKTLKNYQIATMNINYSLNNAQLLFITGIFFVLGFSIVNFNISRYLTVPVIVFLVCWVLTLIKLLQKPLLYV